MDLGWLRGIGTAVLMLSFVGFWIWAYSRRQRQRWTEAAELPFLADRLEAGAADRRESDDD